MEPLDDVRDWLAMEDGWTKPKELGGIWTKRDSNGQPFRVLLGDYRHPHPPTIDGAAAALPEGLRCDMERFQVVAWDARQNPVAVVKRTDDEQDDRYQLAKAARIAMKGKR